MPQRLLRALRRLLGGAPALGRLAGPAALRGMVGTALVAPAVVPGGAAAVELPEDRAEAMFHVYDGGGVRATGPALLIRKSLADKVSLSGSYYVDMVSNASIDVVTTASPFREKRTEYDVGIDAVVRDATMSLSTRSSDEPDYQARNVNLDVSEEVFGGMTTVALGFTRGWDKVGRSDVGYFDRATHWQYRLGLTQVLTANWLASLNLEAVSDEGFLGSPYRAARRFGTTIPENVPRTRSGRAAKLRVVGAWGERASVRAEHRIYWDTWDVRGQTSEIGASRYFGQVHLADMFVRRHSQTAALFYRDNATTETTYLTRNRQLGTFDSLGVGAKFSYSLGRLAGRFESRLHGAYEFKRFNFKDFTDLRTGSPYRHNAHVFELTFNATF